MEIAGVLINKLEVQSGQGRNGPWQKQDFIVETQEQYPKKVCITLWGDKIRELDSFQPGDALKASINIESREFNGRWYTDVKAWRMEKYGAEAPSGPSTEATPPPPPPIPGMDEAPPESSDSTDDLPF